MSVPRVCVRDIGDRGDKEELRRAFSKFGPLTNVWVADNPPGFAYIFFESFKDAEAAVRYLDGNRLCGGRVRVELSPIEDRRRSGGFSNRGRGGGGGFNRNDYRSSSRGRGGQMGGRTMSYEGRDSSYDSGGGRSGYRDSRSDYSDYSHDRSSYSRGRGRGGRGRDDYYSPGRGRGGGRGQYGYNTRGRGSSRDYGGGDYSGGYDQSYSERSSSYSTPRGRGSRGYSRGGYRDGGGGYRDDYSRSSYSKGGYYEDEDYRPSHRSIEGGYRGRGRGRGVSGGYERRQPPSDHSYGSRGRRESQRREEYIRGREREYHSDYGYVQEDSRNRGSRNTDFEYRERRARSNREDYAGHSGKEEYRKHRDDYKKPSSSQDHYREPRRSSEYRKHEREYSDHQRGEYDEEQWEEDYRERSPHRHHHYREKSPQVGSSSKRGEEYLEHSPGYDDYSPRSDYLDRSHDDPDQPAYENVDQYTAVVDDYETRIYSPEHHVEYSDAEMPEHPEYREGDDKHESIVREVHEVEYGDQHEQERYVQLEEKRDSHYEQDHREKDRQHRYSDRRGTSPRRHHSPSSSRKKRSVSGSHTRSATGSPPRIRSPIHSD